MAVLELVEDFIERDVQFDEEDEGVDEEVGDFADLALTGFVEGGDDDFEGFLTDFLGDAGGPGREEFGGIAAFGTTDAALPEG